MEPMLVDVVGAARALGGISPSTVRNLIRRRELEACTVRRRRMVPVRSIERYIERHTTAISDAVAGVSGG